MRKPLVDAAGRYDRAAIMAEAHKQSAATVLRLDLGRCLSFAWSKARQMRAALAMAVAA